MILPDYINKHDTFDLEAQILDPTIQNFVDPLSLVHAESGFFKNILSFFQIIINT